MPVGAPLPRTLYRQGPEAGPVGAQRIGQDVRITSVVLGPSHGRTSVELPHRYRLGAHKALDQRLSSGALHTRLSVRNPTASGSVESRCSLLSRFHTLA